jgi:trehalose-6-phosphate synthase
MDPKLSDTQKPAAAGQRTKGANRMFADAMPLEHREGDIVWVQGLHLILLPEMLKQSHPEIISTRFFIPTPSLPFQQNIFYLQSRKNQWIRRYRPLAG